MSFKDILLQVRSMRRSDQIRNETDPDKVANILENLIKESIHLQNGGDKSFQKRSMAELRQIRQDLVAGQINAGARNTELTVVYSSVIDALSKMEETDSKGFKVYDKTASTLRKSIPSSDTLISALMTANPLMGYGVKMARDLIQSGSDSRKRSKEEDAKKLKLLREQEAYLREQFKNAEDAARAADAEADDAKKDNDDSKKDTTGKPEFESDLYMDILQSIEKEIQMLVDIWNGEPIDRISDSIDELTRQSNENAQNAIDAARELEEKKARDAEIERLRRIDTTGAPTPIPDEVDTNGVREDPAKGGLLSTILGGVGRLLVGTLMGIVGGLTGILAAFTGGAILSTLLKPFKLMLGFIVGIGKMALKLGGRLALPAAIIMAIYDFFDAFFNASKILEKNDSKISIGERISVGIANVLSGIVGMFDSILELFGVDLIDTDGLTKKIHDFFWGFPDMVMKMVDSTWAYTKQIYDDVLTSLDGQVKDVKEGLILAYTGVVNKVMGVFESITSTFKSVIETIEMKFREWKKTIQNIPGVGSLFNTDSTTEIKLDEVAIDKASTDLKEMTSSTNLLRMNEGVATMIPLETASSTAATGVQRAEQKTQVPMQAPVMVNAPTSTVNNINQGGGQQHTNTSNQNHKFRRVADNRVR